MLCREEGVEVWANKGKLNEDVGQKRKNLVDELSYIPKQPKQQHGSSASSSRSNSVFPGSRAHQPLYIDSEDEVDDEEDVQLNPLSNPQNGMQAPPGVAVFNPITSADIARTTFLRHLKHIQGPLVTLSNEVDDTSPPLSYQFIEESKFGPGVIKLDDDFMIGCTCKRNNGRDVGCEYTKCECLQEAEPGPSEKVIFPYYCSGQKSGYLREFYLETRNAVFECNKKCRCQANCKNRNVQHGRKVELEIFKTLNRGWGIFIFVPNQETDHVC